MNFDPTLYLTQSPHNLALGLKLVKFTEQEIMIEMPYQENLVGDPETGVIAGGAVTALLDTACGLGVYARLRAFLSISTIDLRIDYLRSATPGKAILVTADCHRITHHAAFVRALAFHAGEETQPIAHGNGVFSVSRHTVAEVAAKHGGETA